MIVCSKRKRQENLLSREFCFFFRYDIFITVYNLASISSKLVHSRKQSKRLPCLISESWWTNQDFPNTNLFCRTFEVCGQISLRNIAVLLRLLFKNGLQCQDFNTINTSAVFAFIRFCVHKIRCFWTSDSIHIAHSIQIIENYYRKIKWIERFPKLKMSFL